MTHVSPDADRPRHRHDEEAPVLAAIAAEELTRADGDVQSAVAAMTDLVLSDDVLFRALMEPLTRQACYALVSRVCRARRQTVWRSRQPSRRTARRGVRALARGNRQSLFNFPLPGGLRLGDAFREDVEAAFRMYRSHSDDMAWKARWLRLIADAVTPGVKIREQLSERKLRQMKRAAEESR